MTSLFTSITKYNEGRDDTSNSWMGKGEYKELVDGEGTIQATHGWGRDKATSFTSITKYSNRQYQYQSTLNTTRYV